MENIKKLKVKDSIKVKKKVEETIIDEIEPITDDDNKDIKKDTVKEVDTVSGCKDCKYTKGVPSCKNCIFNK